MSPDNPGLATYLPSLACLEKKNPPKTSNRRREPTPLHRPKHISHAPAAAPRDGTVYGLHMSGRNIIPRLHVSVARGFIDRHAVFDETASDIVGRVGEGVSGYPPVSRSASRHGKGSLFSPSTHDAVAALEICGGGLNTLAGQDVMFLSIDVKAVNQVLVAVT